MNMPPKAKASRGYHCVIVADCPHCHREHRHAEGAAGVRTADCLQGEYVLDFSTDAPAKPTDSQAEAAS